MRILLVEDEMLIAMEQRLYLETAGHDVAGPAADADQAAELMTEGLYDLALVDVHLARGTSGIDVARRLASSNIPCLFVTSHPEGVMAERLGLGCLLKPFSSDDLLASVEVASDVLNSRSPAARPRNLILFEDS
jgi:two-component system, response regulator PdtaR